MNPPPRHPDSDPWAAEPSAPDDEAGCRVQNVSCGRCGWPSACVVQQGMRRLSFVCHWCGKPTVGIVDPTIRGTIIF